MNLANVSTPAEIEAAADAGTWAVWHELLRRAGYERHGSQWRRLGDLGYAKLARSSAYPGRVIVFLNDASGRGRPVDAPQFCVEVLGASWSEAIALIEDLAAAMPAETGAGDQTPRPPPSRALHGVAERMREWGIPVDRSALDKSIDYLRARADAGDHRDGYLLRTLEAIRATVGDDGRAHVEWNPGTTVTWRWSCRPSIHFLPREVRAYIFRAVPGRKLVQIDLTAAGLVAAATCSGDPNLRYLVERDDPYRELAGGLIGKPASDVSEGERAAFKQFAVSALAGARRESLAADLPPELRGHVGHFIGMWRNLFRRINHWHSDLMREVILGRPIPVPGTRRVLAPEADHPGQIAHRVIESFVSAHVDRALVEITHKLANVAPSCGVVAMIHDAIVMECTDESCALAVEVARRAMCCERVVNGVRFRWRVQTTVAQT